MDYTVGRAAELYARRVAQAAFAYLKNTEDAEDIAQEVFLELLKRRPAFQNEEHLKAWLFRVAINKSKNALKTASRKNAPLHDALPYLPEEENIALAAVLSLGEKYRIPLHLHYCGGYSIKEIAAILRLPAATVGTRLSRGRKMLIPILGEENL